MVAQLFGVLEVFLIVFEMELATSHRTTAGPFILCLQTVIFPTVSVPARAVVPLQSWSGTAAQAVVPLIYKRYLGQMT